jgi:hypothetical protein
MWIQIFDIILDTIIDTILLDQLVGSSALFKKEKKM